MLRRRWAAERERQRVEVEGERALPEVEVHRRMRVEADDRVERKLRRLRDKGHSKEEAVVRVEDLACREGDAATDRVPYSEARSEGLRTRSRAVEQSAVVRVVPERVHVPSRLAASEREGVGAKSNRDAVDGSRWCGLIGGPFAPGRRTNAHLEVADGASLKKAQLILRSRQRSVGLGV